MKLKRIGSIFLVAVMLLLALSACMGSGEEEEEDTTESDQPTIVSAEEVASYTIVRGDDADEKTIAAASKLQLALKNKYGVKMKFDTDYLKKGESVPTGVKEILVGETNRPESVGVRWSDYRIAATGDKIVIGGGNGESVAKGVDWFIANCIGDEGLTVPAVYATAETYPMKNLKLNGIPLKDYAVAKIQGDDDDTLRTWLGENVGILNVSEHEIRLVADETLLIAQFSAKMKDGNLILSVSPKQADFSYVIERFVKLVESTVKAGKKKIVPFGTDSLTLGIQYKQATTEDLNNLRQETEDHIVEILNTPNMSIPSGAKVYYVSNSAGNDSNNGTSPSTPWKTLSKVNTNLANGSIASGSYICLKRGDMWRETLQAKKGGVTFTAYGTGAKPIICGSSLDGANPNYWVETETPNVWKWVGPAFSGDVGTMVFDDGDAYAYKATLKIVQKNGETQIYNISTGDRFDRFQKDLKTDLHFYHDISCTLVVDSKNYNYTGTGDLYLYSSKGNPGSRFKSIEFSEYKSGVGVSNGSHNLTIDNLCIKNVGVHGISGSGNSISLQNLRVQNCEFEWIGGSVQKESMGREWQTRLGNAIEIYGACDGYYCENNYIHQVYDSGISVQANYYNVNNSIANNLYMKNVNFLNNVIEYCEMPIENWASDITESNPSRFENVLIEGNQIWYAGYGLCESRPPIDRGWSSAIKARCSKTGNRAYNYEIRNNVVALWKIRAVQVTSNLFNPEDGSDSVANFSGNIYVGTYGRKFGQVEVVTGENRDHIDATFDFDVAQYMTEHEDEERGAYLTSDHSDGTDQFWIAP